MRCVVAALALLLLLAIPAAGRADDAMTGHATQPSACGLESDDAVTVPKMTLLADRQAGELIENAIAPSADYARKNQQENAKAADTCEPVRQSAPAPVPALRVVLSSMPLLASQMTSGFGMRVHPLSGDLRTHDGVDLAAPPGAPIFATYSGKVMIAGWSGGYGLLASVHDASGLETRFGHMSRLNVVAGQAVRRGDIIGFVGSTGNSTGPHLHYEMRYKGQVINPLPWLGAVRQTGARVR
jgi:murein DD-endopeptidase MepM/ murein hydrolase activator NlpD